MDVALVIAGNSFVGRHVVRRLAVQGVTCRASSRTPRPGFAHCDLTRPGDIDAILQAVRPRWIFACAGATAVASVQQLRALHVDATEKLIAAMAMHVPNAVAVLFGSAAEYGSVPPELLPVREDVPACPQSSYGQSKLTQLVIARRMAIEHGVRIHVVRPFNLIGPGLGGHFMPGALAERLRESKRAGQSGPIAVPNGDATRDWVDVRDAADAVVRLALDAPPEAGSAGLFNIATGQETPVLTLARHMCKLAGGFEAVNGGVIGSRSAIDRSCGDSQRLRDATGWHPTVPWQQSAADLWDEVARR